MKEVFEYHPYQKSPIETVIGFGSRGFKAQHDPAENERMGREFREAREFAESTQKRLKPQTSKDQQ